MTRKTISILGNITFAITILLSGYILISSYLARRSLPPGVCPIDNNRVLIYIAIGLAIVTFILSFFDRDKSNNMDIDKDKEGKEAN